jgi:hypothetical protein
MFAPIERVQEQSCASVARTLFGHEDGRAAGDLLIAQLLSTLIAPPSGPVRPSSVLSPKTRGSAFASIQRRAYHLRRERWTASLLTILMVVPSLPGRIVILPQCELRVFAIGF